MGKIVRPDLLKFYGREHDELSSLAETLRYNRPMSLTLLRRKKLTESFLELADADLENKEFWKKLAVKCSRLYDKLWNDEITDAEAWRDLMNALRLQVPDKAPTAAEEREKIVLLLRDMNIFDMLSRINSALEKDEWLFALSENDIVRKTYDELKIKFKEEYKYFINIRIEKIWKLLVCEGKAGVTVKAASEIMLEWCCSGAAGNLTKDNSSRYFLDEELWKRLYEEMKADAEKHSWYLRISEWLHCLEVCLEQEPGSLLKEESPEVKIFMEGVAAERESLRAFEEAYLQLGNYRKLFGCDKWFENWKDSTSGGELRAVFFVLASGLVRDDRTRFDRILKAESDAAGKLKDSAAASEIGQLYWKYGTKIADALNNTYTGEALCNVGGFRVAVHAGEALKYILNELSKWKNLKPATLESIKGSACIRSLKNREEEYKYIVRKYNAVLEKRRKELNKVMCSYMVYPSVWNDCKADIAFGVGEKKHCCLIPSGKRMPDNMTLSKCHRVLEYLANNYRCSRFEPLVKAVTFGKREGNRKNYEEIRASVSEINRLRKDSDRFISERRRIDKGLSNIFERIEQKEKTISGLRCEGSPESMGKGLFGKWADTWEEVNCLYKELRTLRDKWEAEESEHWEKEFDSFKKAYSKYRDRVAELFEKCYPLLEMKKEV